jgi:hypothetical protein
MGRLPIHEAHQHHSALIPQEYKNPPPAPVFPLCPARCRPAAPAPVSSSCSAPPCRSTATRLSLHPTRRRRPGAPCFAAGQVPPFGLLPDGPSPGFLLPDAVCSLSPAGSRATATGSVLPKPLPSSPMSFPGPFPFAWCLGHLWRSKANASRTPPTPYLSDSRHPQCPGSWLAPTPRRRPTDALKTMVVY